MESKFLFVLKLVSSQAVSN